jgi:hypothetical protein
MTGAKGSQCGLRPRPGPHPAAAPAPRFPARQAASSSGPSQGHGPRGRTASRATRRRQDTPPRAGSPATRAAVRRPAAARPASARMRARSRRAGSDAVVCRVRRPRDQPSRSAPFRRDRRRPSRPSSGRAPLRSARTRRRATCRPRCPRAPMARARGARDAERERLQTRASPGAWHGQIPPESAVWQGATTIAYPWRYAEEEQRSQAAEDGGRCPCQAPGEALYSWGNTQRTRSLYVT